MIELMTPLMIADSSSYTFLLMEDAAIANRAEFKTNLKMQLTQWYDNYNKALAEKSEDLTTLGLYELADNPEQYKRQVPLDFGLDETSKL